MSFLEILGEFSERDIAGVGNKFLPALMRQGLQAGLSGNQMLQAFRSAGLGIGTQRFYGLLGEIAATEGMQASIGAIPLSQELSESDFAEWTTARASGYLYQVRAYFQSEDPLTHQLIRTFRPFDVRSPDIITQEEALGIAHDYADSGGGPGSDQTLVGLEITGLFHMTGGRG